MRPLLLTVSEIASVMGTAAMASAECLIKDAPV